MGRGSGADKQINSISTRGSISSSASFAATHQHENRVAALKRPRSVQGELVSLIQTDDGFWKILAINGKDNQIQRVLVECDADDLDSVETSFENWVSERGQALTLQ